jgi:P2-related tail formation protein
MLSDFDAKKKEMIDILEGISIDNISSHEGISIQVGSKVFQFKGIDILETKDIESRIRNEFKIKINAQQQNIREKINSKINQLITMYSQKQTELDRKEKDIIRKYSNYSVMPELTTRHVANGLFVSKGTGNSGLIWVYKGCYNPKFIINSMGVRCNLDIKNISRLKRDMFIFIKTQGDTVLGVETHKTNDIDMVFDHYHQAYPDCWGHWKYDAKWKTADDILMIAQKAEAVLETINYRSIALRNPPNMIRSDILEQTSLPIVSHETKVVEKLPEIVIPEPRRRGRPRTRPLPPVTQGTDIWAT